MRYLGLADYDPSVHGLTDPLFREPLTCICVDSSLSTCVFLSPCTLYASASIVYCPRASTPHPYTLPARTRTLLYCARWTPARILRPSHIHHGRSIPGQLMPAACGATSMRTACTLRVERPRRTAVHFFPHTRPPDTHSHPLDR